LKPLSEEETSLKRAAATRLPRRSEFLNELSAAEVAKPTAVPAAAPPAPKPQHARPAQDRAKKTEPPSRPQVVVERKAEPSNWEVFGGCVILALAAWGAYCLVF
jgi:hypothetical protein